ncbi:MAG TPA: SDR family NAD(P)-dependent oxidoreductase [Candidatus Methylomirabilis sp.]|nr:SDR family NAD(P)-dependent oxidoreductase [Candidatus Methylomirabilis sp.]
MQESRGNRDRDLGIAGKLAVITGAGWGIGRATAMLFARWGARVAAVDIDPDALGAVAKAIRDIGGEAETAVADVCAEEPVVRLFETLSRKYGGIHILVNVVGGGNPARLTEITGVEWDRMFAFNTRSSFLCSREAARHMTEGGRIINVASLAGQSSSVLQGAHYTASKAAVIGLTRHMARELAPRGITVNAIAPGTTATQRIEGQLTPEKRQALISRIPLGRLATPEDQAGVILFLASSLAGYVTGVTIDVSGGMLLG